LIWNSGSKTNTEDLLLTRAYPMSGADLHVKKLLADEVPPQRKQMRKARGCEWHNIAKR
jgi:hypothetical protein